ncbi:MAG: hypothetical protein HYR85_15750 [Planctomycetes bacterium]|nr:hypothetical protein [Planctomycetota bacterium]MBI3848115.1 hypothetical protein [Planctomycetota bacterium]
MRFLFILTQIEEAWTKAPLGSAERVREEYLTLEQELKKNGKFVESIRLRPRNEAKTLRNRPNGKRTQIEGTYTETAEVMGGLYILDFTSMNEALEWARRMPNYGHGAIEVRPIWD